MEKIKTVGVVGAGTMGSALAQKFAQENFNVILADREMRFVEKGIAGIRLTLNEGVEKKIFTPIQVGHYLSNIKCTADLNDLKGCDMVIEAVFEDFNVKSELFKNISSIVDKETIIATNTSSFSVAELCKSITRPERFIGMHYFYHAAKNRLVEIIPCETTSDETYRSMKMFALLSGKDAITTRDVYGFAVNRFFVPWLNEAVRLLEEGVADTNRIDQVCMKIFGIGMGPFALMNATGVSIAYHAEKTLEAFGGFYKSADLLKVQAESKTNWEIEQPTEELSPSEADEIVRQRMLGVVFFVCSQILEENICSVAELNRGAKIGLRWKYGPIDLMKKSGEVFLRDIICLTSAKYHMNAPAILKTDDLKIEYVQLETFANRAVITMSRPEDLNALNKEVMEQLAAKFEIANRDENIDTIFITGTGKAFVAGADIKFFIQNIKSSNIPGIINFTKAGQEVLKMIDTSTKKVVAIINGLALGGGLELALCADTILAFPQAMMSFPETGIGIYPGLGGTQRAAKKIGKGFAKYLIYTGKMLNAKEAENIGLIDGIIQPDEMFDLFEGRIVLPTVTESKSPDAKWMGIQHFFKTNHISEILDGTYSTAGLSQEEADKLVKTVKRKAPIALNISEKLIDKAKGCESELEHLSYIFSTSDALLGLSSIGKKVEFKGE